MDERTTKGPCFSHNRKWSRGHKFQETKLFTLENNDEGEIEALRKMGGEEMMGLK